MNREDIYSIEKNSSIELSDHDLLKKNYMILNRKFKTKGIDERNESKSIKKKDKRISKKTNIPAMESI